MTNARNMQYRYPDIGTECLDQTYFMDFLIKLTENMPIKVKLHSILYTKNMPIKAKLYPLLCAEQI